MKNINKQRKVNTNELERYSEELSKSEIRQNRENMLTLLVIVIGLVGFIFVFQSSTNSDGKSLVIPPHFPKEKAKETNKTKQADTKSITNQQMLNIDGVKEANEVLKFVIDSYDRNADYQIDFGNGVIRTITEKSSFYSYPASGNYEVQLIVSYDGKEKALKKKIFIDKAVKRPIELVESSY